MAAVKGDYSYPLDEFDAASSQIRPSGAHRTARSRGRRLMPFVVVLLVFPLLAYGLVTWLSRSDVLPAVGGPAATDGSTEAGADGAAAGAPDATSAGTTDDGGGEAGSDQDGTSPVETTAAEPPPSPAPEPDLSRPVEIYNATGRTGLAGGAAARVEEAGFNDVTTNNWAAEDPPESVVWYAVQSDAGTAQAVAAELGIGRVELSPEVAADGVVVVLTTDYEG